MYIEESSVLLKGATSREYSNKFTPATTISVRGLRSSTLRVGWFQRKQLYTTLDFCYHHFCSNVHACLFYESDNKQWFIAERNFVRARAKRTWAKQNIKVYVYIYMYIFHVAQCLVWLFFHGKCFDNLIILLIQLLLDSLEINKYCCTRIRWIPSMNRFERLK